MRATEDAWVGRLTREHLAKAPRSGSVTELFTALGELHAAEETDVPESQDYLALSASTDEFRTEVAQLAADDLIESQGLLAVVPRLPYRSGTAVFRVLIDEFGTRRSTWVPESAQPVRPVIRRGWPRRWRRTRTAPVKPRR